MKEIEFDGHMLQVPNSWDDIKLGDYERWYTAKHETHQEYLQYIADICKLDVKQLLDCPAQALESLAEATQFVSNTDFEPQNVIDIDGEKYFISHSDKLTLGEWIDAEGVLKSEDEQHKLSQVLAILCRPVGEVYDIEIAAQRVEMFQNMPCNKALPLLGFFLHKNLKLEETLHHCSQVVAQANQLLKDTKTFATSGDGIKPLPIWQRIRYFFLMKSLEKQLLKFSDSCSTK